MNKIKIVLAALMLVAVLPANAYIYSDNATEVINSYDSHIDPLAGCPDDVSWSTDPSTCHLPTADLVCYDVAYIAAANLNNPKDAAYEISADGLYVPSYPSFWNYDIPRWMPTVFQIGYYPVHIAYVWYKPTGLSHAVNAWYTGGNKSGDKSNISNYIFFQYGQILTPGSSWQFPHGASVEIYTSDGLDHFWTLP
jgi:hypothetical protein